MWTRASCIAAVQNWASIYGDPPTTHECNKNDTLPDMNHVKSLFGRHSEMVRAAGYKPRGRGRPYHLVPFRDTLSY